MEAWRDLVDRESLPISLLPVAVLHLHLAIDDEFKDAVSGLSCADRIFAVLERDCSILLKVDGISEVVVDEDVADDGLIRLKAGACARPWQTILVLQIVHELIGMDLARGIHSQWHHIAIFALESERAHRPVNTNATLADRVGVGWALVANELASAHVNRCEAAVWALVMAVQSEDWLGQRLLFLVDPAVLLCRLLRVHVVVSHKVKERCMKKDRQ